MEIKVGKSYTGRSGAVKKVAAVDDKTVSYTITEQGAGKGNHLPVGTTGVQTVSSFKAWVVKAV